MKAVGPPITYYESWEYDNYNKITGLGGCKEFDKRIDNTIDPPTFDKAN